MPFELTDNSLVFEELGQGDLFFYRLLYDAFMYLFIPLRSSTSAFNLGER